MSVRLVWSILGVWFFCVGVTTDLSTARGAVALLGTLVCLAAVLRPGGGRQ